jgi:hypothetical protein
MSTKTLLDRIVPQIPGYSRSTGNRSLLVDMQAAMDELTNTNAACRIYKGSDNLGFPPYLKTVADTYDYEIIADNLSASNLVKKLNGTNYPINARVINKVFVDVTQATHYGIRFIGKPYPYTGHNPYSTANSRLFVADIGVNSYPRQEGTPARVHFNEAPTAGDEIYFVEFTYESPRLLSELIPIDVPSEYEQAIEDYVVGLAQIRANGKMSDRYQNFFDYWKPRFDSLQDGGAQDFDWQTQARTC